MEAVFVFLLVNLTNGLSLGPTVARRVGPLARSFIFWCSLTIKVPYSSDGFTLYIIWLNRFTKYYEKIRRKKEIPDILDIIKIGLVEIDKNMF